MAELQNEGLERCDDSNTPTMVSEASHGIKRPHDSNHISGPPQKSPCTSPAPSGMQNLGEEQQSDDPKTSCVEDGMTVNLPAPESNHRLRRKSWRRSSRGRRSLPAFQSTSQPLCESISLSLSDNERLTVLMKAAMQKTVKRAKNSLYTIPGVDTEILQTQIESLHEKWDTVAEEISNETQTSLPSVDSDPVVKEISERIQKDINRLQAESLSWESLLNKHRTKAEELDKCVERGEEKGVPLDQSCLAKSSQSQIIQSKPDYKAVLIRQQNLLRNMELVMDSKCRITRELLSFHENSHLLLKETSARMASRAGLQNPSFSPIRKLIKGPVSSVQHYF